MLQVRNALKYVLNNHLKHKTALNVFAAPGDPDVFSSGRYFDGWIERPPEVEAGVEGAIVVQGGWKLSRGWRRHHREIGDFEVPGSLGGLRRNGRDAL